MVSVTLKKAASLASQLSLVKVEHPHQYTVSPHEENPSEAAFDAAKQLFEESVNKYGAITNAVFLIRGLVMKANEGKINELIHLKTLLTKQLAYTQTIPSIKTGSTPASVARELDALRLQMKDTTNPSNVRYASAMKVAMQIETAEFVNAQISRLKRALLEVDDNLTRLNYSTTVEIPEDVVTLLRSYDLI